MWPRVVVVMLAAWLAISPFVFGNVPHEPRLIAIDFGSATALAFFALLSFAPRARRAHFFNIVVALWLIAVGFVSPTSPASQNHIIVGLLVLMLAILPSRSNIPPRRWREFLAAQS